MQSIHNLIVLSLYFEPNQDQNFSRIDYFIFNFGIKNIFFNSFKDKSVDPSFTNIISKFFMIDFLIVFINGIMKFSKLNRTYY